MRAGQVPFRTDQGLDVLPIEAVVYYKRLLASPEQKLKDYYKLLYASYQDQPPLGDADFQLYETVPLDGRTAGGVALGQDTVDNSLWIALLVRAGDKPKDNSEKARAELRDEVRKVIAGKTVSLGLAPALDEAVRRLSSAGQANPQGETLLQYQIPAVPADGRLLDNPRDRVPQYKSLDVRAPTDVLAYPGVVEITLPPASELQLWSNLDPLEAGVGDFPPALDDTTPNDRVITWLRIRASAAVRTRLLWVGINAVFVTQRTHVATNNSPTARARPIRQRCSLNPRDSRVRACHRNDRAGVTTAWQEIDDLLSAGPEVQVHDPRYPPGATACA